MKKKRIEGKQFGTRFGKTDLDRVGFFDDPSPAPFDRYRGFPVEFREGIEKGRQVLAGPSGTLFEKKFVRIFSGEALTEPWRIEAKKRLQDEKRKIGKRMLPPSPSKKHSTPGDWHGCFEKISSFSPQLRQERRKKGKVVSELPNVKIKPNPLGGPGYANITLSPFPSSSPEPYDPVRKGKAEKKAVGRFLSAVGTMDYFPPNPYKGQFDKSTYARPIEVKPAVIGTGIFYVPFPKKPGGKHDGCFDKFPSYSSDPYVKERKKVETEPVFATPAAPFISKYTNSIIEQVTKRSCNLNNYLEYTERVYPLY